MKLNELLQSDHFEEKEEICPGCQNHCQVRVYSFANGRQYVSGNNCERVYSNEARARIKASICSRRSTTYFSIVHRTNQRNHDLRHWILALLSRKGHIRTHP